MNDSSIGREGGRSLRSRLLTPFAVALGALTVMLVLAAPGARTTEAAEYPYDFGQRDVLADYYTNCLPFSTVGSYLDPYGYPVYQPLPVYGNPFTLFSQCIAQPSCGVYGYNSYNVYYNNYFNNPCVTYCSTSLEQVYPNGSQVCPGPPASILFAPNPSDMSCGGASNLQVVVLDGNGLRVRPLDVTFSTTLGYVSTKDGTQDGIAYTSLTIPTKTWGTAIVTATAGNASAQKVVNITC